jgi:tRNA(Ile)-lysidine synthase TilS/MesJ
MIKRCSKCILPETVPGITFDKNGICSYCSEFAEKPEEIKSKFQEREGRFNKIIDRVKERKIKDSSRYDVLVPISGGRDSSYITWKLSNEYKLRVLCVNYANPYTSKQAIKNIEHLVNVTNSGLIRFSYPNRIHERSFEKNLKAWIKKPDLGTLGLICLACKPMYMEFYRIANENKIELIIDGANIFEVTTFKMEAQGGKGAKNLLSMKTLKNISLKIINNLRYCAWCNILSAIKTLLSLNGTTPYLKFRYPNIIKVPYFYIFPYDEKEINKTLNSIGWKKAEDNISPWRFDCEIDSIKNYIYQKSIGATEKDDLFSKYIRYGLATREEALQRLNEGNVNTEIVERILERIGLNISDLDKACKKIECNVKS